MSLTSLSLINFQAHKDTHIEFDPHITAIVGSSDSGKTSILRSLYWVLQNKPAGVQMVSFWNRKKDGSPKGTTASILRVGDHTISRVRSPERNGYDWDSQELSAIGRDVPEKITDYLNLSDINISRQFDRHFLLSESSGEVARRLNELVRLDIIDKTLSQTEKDKRVAKKEVAEAQEAISLYQKKLDALSWVGKAEVLVKELEQAEAYQEQAEEGSRKLTNALSGLKTYTDTITAFGRIVEAGRGLIDEISSELSKKEQISDQIDTLLGYQSRISVIQEQGEEFTKMKPARRLLECLEEAYQERAEIEKDMEGLEEYKEALQKLDSDLGNLYIEMETAKKELPEICPLCGHKLEEKE